MKELILNSSKDINEIEKDFSQTDFFSELMDGLTEALAHSKGQASAKSFTRKRALPSIDVSAVRASLGMTQKAFAAALGVSCRTVEAWESGKSNPTPTAKKLIHLIQEDHSILQKLIV
jgi:putative transcriptional regulator